MTEQHIALLRARILDSQTFVRATLSGKQRGADLPWIRLVIRPVMLKSGRCLQFSYFDARQDITKNYAGDEAAARLDEALALPFSSFAVQSTNGDLHVQITKKGKAIIHESGGPQPRLPDLSHDHQKETPLPAAAPDPYLQAVGIMTHDGKIKAAMQNKFRQINKFLQLVGDTGELEQMGPGVVRVVDCGCGSAYLTFALFHYMTHVLKLQVELTGVDVNEKLLAEHAEKIASLGWGGLSFEAARIIDYEPGAPVDITVALHACDTATDEAIARGVQWNSRLIVCAPCCQHDLQVQLSRKTAPTPFGPVMRHGLFFERMGDLLTDSFRVLLLRLMGYRVDVVEFVPSEHTPRNLMIRAVKTAQPGDPKILNEYLSLRDYWQVRPHLEKLLEKRLTALSAPLPE